MKRTITMILALALVLSTLVGCKGDKEASSSVEMTIMMHNNENGASGDSEIIKKMIEMTGLDINVISAPAASYGEKLNVTLASGNLPDIVYMDEKNVNSWIEEGALLPLDDLIDKYAPNFKKVFTEEDRKELVNPEDFRQYGVPYILRLPAQYTMGVRRDWLDILGLEAPTTIEELETVLTAFKDNPDKLNGGAEVIPMAGQLSAMYMLFGIAQSGDRNAWTLDENGKYITKYEHPNYRQCLETLQRFYAKGLIDPEFLTRNNDSGALYGLFNAGTAGMGFVFSTRLREITEILRKTNPDALFDYMAPVDGVDGEKHIPGRKVLGTQGCITIAAEGKEKECMEFLDWCYSEEGDRLFNYGIEGKSYDMVDGKPVIRDEYNHGWVEIRKLGCVPTNIGYNRNLDAYNQCMFYGKDIEELDEFEKLTYKAYYENEPYIVKPIRAFSTETSLSRGTDIYSFLSEKEAKVIMGKISVDEFFTELETIKADGLDDMTKEMQACWDSIQ